MNQHRLPTDPYERTIALVRMSAPSPDAPLTGLPSDLDRMVREGDRDRAVLYASMDDISDRCRRLADEIESSGVVVDVIDPDDDCSLVTSLDGVHIAVENYTAHH